MNELINIVWHVAGVITIGGLGLALVAGLVWHVVDTIKG